jgi:hypothetical protein
MRDKWIPWLNVNSGAAMPKVCAKFVTRSRQMGLLRTPSVAINGNRFKAVKSRDSNFTLAYVARRMAQIEDSAAKTRAIANLQGSGSVHSTCPARLHGPSCGRLLLDRCPRV